MRVAFICPTIIFPTGPLLDNYLPDSHFPDNHFPDSHFPDSHLPDSHFPDNSLSRQFIFPTIICPTIIFPTVICSTIIIYRTYHKERTKINQIGTYTKKRWLWRLMSWPTMPRLFLYLDRELFRKTNLLISSN